MAACGSLQHIFENPLPENPTLLESLSPWNQIKPVKKPSNIEQSSFTEIFGELHFKENSLFLSSSSSSAPVSSSSSSSLVDLDLKSKFENRYDEEKKIITPPLEYSFSSSKYNSSHKNSDSFSLRNSESLQLCTEGLGFESSDYEVEDLTKEARDWQKPDLEKPSVHKSENNLRQGLIVGETVKRSRTAAGGGKGGFPPPISCLSKSGKPWVCFKSYRQDGRFVLKEIRVRSQEFLHACREDGRLKLHFVQPNDEIPEDKEEEELDGDLEEDGDDNGVENIEEDVHETEGRCETRANE
ncbi:hypothetical protein L484_022326 [Morus notabilis]|uniref:FAF domain-containing protein n=1 Tax=Morus notabilis TaxID=981085 RepID=W9R5C2_9ROSA|nr:hypothetical protein L484_022326 [Morus notabilis]